MRQIQSAQQRLGMAMDYYLANRSRRFTQIFTVCNSNIRNCLARQQTALERLRQRMDLRLRIKQANQRQQCVSQRLSQQNPQPSAFTARMPHPTV